ncbi:hypothetical protein BJ508DRAFT_337068 [Ascobolus immersus RN42]|uniref:Uncharacterized protein n=1 Tax=Ascobolus immersus RN42 TaxID=1160509 RepID=A0A3N4HEE2_ASCIM|nr:hypothetical protein BJ508DRAFT_337068 [Ascobolus immersus RN42]
MAKTRGKPKKTRKQINEESNARKRERDARLREALLNHLKEKEFNIQSIDMVHLHPENYRQPGVCLPYIWQAKGGYSIPTKAIANLNQGEQATLLSALQDGNLYAKPNPNPTTYGYRSIEKRKDKKDYVAEWDWEVEYERDSDLEKEDYDDVESLDGKDKEAEEEGSRELVGHYVEHLGTGTSLGTAIGEEMDEEEVEELTEVFGFN